MMRALIHRHHVLDAQLKQAINKMHPYVISADGTEVLNSDLTQDDSIGRLSGPQSLPFFDGSVPAHAALPKKYAAPSGIGAAKLVQ